MTAVRIHHRYADQPVQPWANGAGATVELSGFDEPDLTGTRAGWRLSIAAEREPAAFSPLPGITRTLLAVDGDLLLRIDGVEHDMRAGSIIRFDGGAETELLALSRPCSAVNLMCEADAIPLTLAVVQGDLPAETIAAVAVADDLDEPAGIRQFDLLVPDAGGSVPRTAVAAVVPLPGLTVTTAR